MSTVLMNCRRCGAEFAFPVAETVFSCPFCNALHERPKAQEGSFQGLNRANALRSSCDYANAESVYQDVLEREPEAHEALWGLVLCKYGVEYVVDPKTRRRMPTLHFLRSRSILEDGDYLRACEKAPKDIRAQYEADAAYVEEIHKGLMADAEKGSTFDIFLCYKGSGDDGKGQAREYEHAFRLYHHLKGQGYRVFFAHETLKNEAGARYEASIFRVLHTARVMLVICSEPKNLMSPWVHSEWSRFMERVDDGEACLLIPLLYDGCNPYAMPVAISRRQGINMQEPDAFEKLGAKLKEKLRPAVVKAPVQHNDRQKGQLLPIEYALSNGKWQEAERLAAALIKEQPTCARGYLYKFLARWQIPEESKLCEQLEAFENDVDWTWAMRLASEEESEGWTAILNASLDLRHQREEEARQAKEKRAAAARRRAEEKRLAEERARWLREERIAEEKRAAEEKQRKENERRAEERRAAEEKQRKAKERRAEKKRLVEEKARQVRLLLKEKKWEQAGARAREMPGSPDKYLLQMLAKYQLTDEKELTSCRRGWYDDPLLLDYYNACSVYDDYDDGSLPEPDESEYKRLEQIKQYEKQAQRKAYWIGEIGGVLKLLLTAIPMYLLVVVQKYLLPQYQWPMAMEWSMLIAALIAFAAFMICRGKDNFNNPLFTYSIIALVCGGVVAAAVYLPSEIAGVCWWPYASVLITVFTLILSFVMADDCVGLLILPCIWLALYLACSILTGFFDVQWLQVVKNIVAYFVPGAIAIFHAVMKILVWL